MDLYDLEASLKLLAPIDDESDNKRSPMRMPTVTPSETFSSDDEIQTIISDEERDSEEEPVSEEEEELEVSESKVSPVTPQRFKVETPRTPVRKFNEVEEDDDDSTLYDKLKNLRYTVLRYLVDEETGSALYAVCFDPTGQITFIDLDKEEISSPEFNNIVYIRKNKTNEIKGAFIDSILNKITLNIVGVTFYNGTEYSFMERDDRGDFSRKTFNVVGQEDNKLLSLPQTFILIRLSELLREPLYILESTTENYQIVQQQQLFTNKFTLDKIMKNVKNINILLKNFDSVYKTHADNIVNDWNFLSKFASNYYDKYSRQELTEEEKIKYDKVSINMFVRFQLFNNNVEIVDKLREVNDYICKSNEYFKEAIKSIKEKDDDLSGKVIPSEEVNIFI